MQKTTAFVTLNKLNIWRKLFKGDPRRTLNLARRFLHRKVNGIEKVIIPKLGNTETYILMEMDERVCKIVN